MTWWIVAFSNTHFCLFIVWICIKHKSFQNHRSMLLSGNQCPLSKTSSICNHNLVKYISVISKMQGRVTMRWSSFRFVNSNNLLSLNVVVLDVGVWMHSASVDETSWKSFREKLTLQPQLHKKSLDRSFMRTMRPFLFDIKTKILNKVENTCGYFPYCFRPKSYFCASKWCRTLKDFSADKRKIKLFEKHILKKSFQQFRTSCACSWSSPASSSHCFSNFHASLLSAFFDNCLYLYLNSLRDPSYSLVSKCANPRTCCNASTTWFSGCHFEVPILKVLEEWTSPLHKVWTYQ